VPPREPTSLDVVDPASEEVIARVTRGSPDDVDLAVAAARRAFADFAQTTVDERLALLRAILAALERHAGALAELLTRELGAPIRLARTAHTGAGVGHLHATIAALAAFPFACERGTTRIVHEPIGVCGLITPWNWPISQIVCKVATALAAGCTMVLKPAEQTPQTAGLLAQVFAEAGVPAGVFNLVHGEGPVAGAALAAHPDVDMLSFTGSTRAGAEVAIAAAPTIKRVVQELGGKSAYLVLDDVDLERTVGDCVVSCFTNSGQTCFAPTRLIVPRELHAAAVAVAREVTARLKVGPPGAGDTRLGPVVNLRQWLRIQDYIQGGIDAGATLVAGGTGRPPGLGRGHYVQPTVFAHVHKDMSIARDEIFGPVLAIMPCADEADAIAIANASPYGLAGHVRCADRERARRVAALLRTGTVQINGASLDFAAPFGGYRRSGNGREWGDFGLREFLEIKSIVGYGESR
jgi:aldehyde dehydrogenase (NAD+)